ncbi:MAG TPA: YCF48-related protein [Bacillota bacterium]|nr:YCF48-related protein [Bacillota bacterium]
MGGCWGELYGTQDGGQHWTLLQSTNHWQMNAIDMAPGFPGQPLFASASAGWVPIDAGAGPGVGGVAWTVDGGRSWTRVGYDKLWDIHVLATADGRTVWALGDRHGDEPTTSYLIRSRDGGRTWSQVLPALSPAGALAFTDATHGYGAGLSSDPSAVLATSDGGATWSEVGRIPAVIASALSFVGTNGWAGDSAGHLLHTTNGGQAWTALPSAADGVVYLRFFDPTHGVRMTRHLAAGVQTLDVATTADGVRQWTPPQTVRAGTDFAAAAFSRLPDHPGRPHRLPHPAHDRRRRHLDADRPAAAGQLRPSGGLLPHRVDRLGGARLPPPGDAGWGCHLDGA